MSSILGGRELRHAAAPPIRADFAQRTTQFLVVHACRYGHFIGRRGIQSLFRDAIITDYVINIPDLPFGAKRMECVMVSFVGAAC